VCVCLIIQCSSSSRGCFTPLQQQLQLQQDSFTTNVRKESKGKDMDMAREG